MPTEPGTNRPRGVGTVMHRSLVCIDDLRPKYFQSLRGLGTRDHVPTWCIVAPKLLVARGRGRPCRHRPAPFSGPLPSSLPRTVRRSVGGMATPAPRCTPDVVPKPVEPPRHLDATLDQATSHPATLAPSRRCDLAIRLPWTNGLARQPARSVPIPMRPQHRDATSLKKVATRQGAKVSR
jgi:hypothetical protein